MGNEVRLDWDGKRAAKTQFSPLPVAYTKEVYRQGASDLPYDRLIQGDNLRLMAALRAELTGKFALIYLDPPFFTGADWMAEVADGTNSRQLPAYRDSWQGDIGVYLQWLYDRLRLAHELLAADGCLYLHLSWHAAHYGRLLLDEIFGAARFQNEIIWCYREAINSKKRWNRKHDTLLLYSKGPKFTFNYGAVREPYAESHVRKYRLRDEKGPYRLMGRGIVDSPLRSRRDLPPDYENRFPGLTYRHYLGEGTLPLDYWLIDIENQASRVRTGYPTQKPEKLLERILLASSNPGDLIADFCCGSGTTPTVASRLGRRWIACDAGTLAIHTTRKRLLESSGDFHFRLEEVGEPDTGHQLKGPEVCAEEREGVALEWGEHGVRVRLSTETTRAIDMWAIQWLAGTSEGEDASFVPEWWAARTRRSPSLVDVSAVVPLEHACAGARIALTDSAGNTVLRTATL